MIIQISDVRPDETIEIRVDDGVILKRPTESVNILIQRATKGSTGPTPSRPGGGSPHRRAIDF